MPADRVLIRTTTTRRPGVTPYGPDRVSQTVTDLVVTSRHHPPVTLPLPVGGSAHAIYDASGNTVAVRIPAREIVTVDNADVVDAEIVEDPASLDISDVADDLLIRELARRRDLLPEDVGTRLDAPAGRRLGDELATWQAVARASVDRNPLELPHLIADALARLGADATVEEVLGGPANEDHDPERVDSLRGHVEQARW